MKRKTKPSSRTRNLQQGANMPEFLAQLRSSGRIHFVKALPKTSLYRHPRETAKLCVPDPFVQDHAAEVGEFVTLRVRTSRGRSSRSWPAHCCVSTAKSAKSGVKVAIAGGWPAFAVDNRLKLGDFVVLVLREDAKSEFEVHVFRGPRAFPYFPDQGERSNEDEEEQEGGSSDSENEEETNNQAFRRDIREENPAPLQHTGNPRVPPRFCKRLKAFNIRGSSGQLHAAQFEFPNRFIRAHSEHVHDTVKLQGIHENSRNYVMPCRRRPRNLFKFLSKTPATDFEVVPGTRSSNNNFSSGRGLTLQQQPFLRKLIVKYHCVSHLLPSTGAFKLQQGNDKIDFFQLITSE